MLPIHRICNRDKEKSLVLIQVRRGAKIRNIHEAAFVSDEEHPLVFDSDERTDANPVLAFIAVVNDYAVDRVAGVACNFEIVYSITSVTFAVSFIACLFENLNTVHPSSLRRLSRFLSLAATFGIL